MVLLLHMLMAMNDVDRTKNSLNEIVNKYCRRAKVTITNHFNVNVLLLLVS